MTERTMCPAVPSNIGGIRVLIVTYAVLTSGFYAVSGLICLRSYIRTIYLFPYVYDPWLVTALICFVIVILYFVFLSRWLALDSTSTNARVGVTPGILLVCLNSFLLLFRLPREVCYIVFSSLTVLTLSLFYWSVWSNASALLVGAAHAVAAYFLTDLTLAVSLTATLFVVLVGKILVSHLVRELCMQYRMIDQARWAATEFAGANMRLHDTLSVSAITNSNKERNRLAGEIHDTIGYTLTAVLIQIRALREVLRIGDERSLDIIDESERVVQSGIYEVRKEIYALKAKEPVRLSWPVRWKQLGRNFADCTGTRVDFNIPEDLPPMGDDIGETVYKIVQESLTNSIRHGRASLIDVTMLFQEEEDRLLLRISDNGQGADKVVAGVGLRGITERVHRMRGSVAWETRPARGFDLGIEIPFRQE